jgi:CRISPR-associated protein Cas1
MVSGRNRHATHPMNAMLNYAYAVLESQVRIATVSQGLDPTIGYLHACRPGRVALVYDLMEPLRPRVDHLVLDFLQSHTFAPSDCALGADGVCRLHPQLTRKVAGLTVADTAVLEIVLWLLGTFRQFAN